MKDRDRRKRAIEAYRDTPTDMGVYRVRSTASGRAVIGSSTDLRSMLNRQRAQLSLGSHPDAVLQAEWDSLGADAFVFEVLDTLEQRDDPAYDPRRDLAELLAMWRERLAAGE